MSKISEIYRKLRGDNIIHFTHTDNIPKILEYRKLFSSNNLLKNNIEAVHMTNGLSRELDKRSGLNNYVFFTFSEKHPLIYKQKMNNIPLIPINIDISIIDLPNVLISDRVANSNSAIFYTPEQALEKLKIKYCHSGRVNNRAIWDEVIKYEILIPNDVDISKYIAKEKG